MATQIRRNSGLFTLRRLAKGMCQAVVTFGPYLKLFFADRPSLVAAIDAVSGACQTLVVEIDEARAAIYPP